MLRICPNLRLTRTNKLTKYQKTWKGVQQTRRKGIYGGPRFRKCDKNRQSGTQKWHNSDRQPREHGGLFEWKKYYLNLKCSQLLQKNKLITRIIV